MSKTLYIDLDQCIWNVHYFTGEMNWAKHIVGPYTLVSPTEIHGSNGKCVLDQDFNSFCEAAKLEGWTICILSAGALKDTAPENNPPFIFIQMFNIPCDNIILKHVSEIEKPDHLDTDSIFIDDDSQVLARARARGFKTIDRKKFVQWDSRIFTLVE